MNMSGTVDLGARRDVVWAKLNDPAVLKTCIPGCQSLEITGENEFQAVVVNKIGPVSAKFTGRVKLSDINPTTGYRISGEGDGGVAGFAKGGAVVELSDNGTGTTLTYNVDAQIGGKLAQLGQRLINGVAKKMADEFFTRFAGALQAS